MIPTYEDLMLPMLRHLADGKEHSLSEVHDVLAVHFDLDDEEIRQLLPSGRQPVLRNRVGWARTYLKKAGLLQSTRRAHFKITSRGQQYLNENPQSISTKDLSRFEEFVAFKTLRNSEMPKNSAPAEAAVASPDKTPEEDLEYAFEQIEQDLSNELVELVKKCSPAFFEKLVIDLLINMGYGGSRKDAGEAMGKSGDGGIDGIIKEDKLGLDVIYLQAKRWSNAVPVKEIRDFTGALASKKAKKGIFITTSSFPKTVYEFVKQVEYKIILIDGNRLTRLMVDHDVGLSVVNTYHIKAIDFDYFEQN